MGSLVRATHAEDWAIKRQLCSHCPGFPEKLTVTSSLEQYCKRDQAHFTPSPCCHTPFWEHNYARASGRGVGFDASSSPDHHNQVNPKQLLAMWVKRRCVHNPGAQRVPCPRLRRCLPQHAALASQRVTVRSGPAKPPVLITMCGHREAKNVTPRVSRLEQ